MLRWTRRLSAADNACITSRHQLRSAIAETFAGGPPCSAPKSLATITERCSDLQLSFLAAYQFAMRELFRGAAGASTPRAPLMAPCDMIAFAFTESTGNRLADIKTTIEASNSTSGGGDSCVFIDGYKSFVTAASSADSVVVVGQMEEGFGAAIVHLSREGETSSAVEFVPCAKKLHFVPDIDHGGLRFTRTPGSLLSRDGAAVSKRFRLLEDVFVSIAVTANIAARLTDQFVMGCCPSQNDDAERRGFESTFSQVLACRDVLCSMCPVTAPMGSIDVATPDTLVRLHGTLAWAKEVCHNAAKLIHNDSLRNVIVRDLQLLDVAQKVRDVRLQKALAKQFSHHT